MALVDARAGAPFDASAAQAVGAGAFRGERAGSQALQVQVAPNGEVPTHAIMRRNDIWFAPNCKTNVGLGRPLVKEA